MTMCRWSMLLVLAVASVANADCVEQPRKVALDRENQVPFKSYECRVGAASDRVRVEFHRFSDTAASLNVGKGSSDVLRKIIGTPTVVENDVFKQYADL